MHPLVKKIIGKDIISGDIKLILKNINLQKNENIIEKILSLKLFSEDELMVLIAKSYVLDTVDLIQYEVLTFDGLELLLKKYPIILLKITANEIIVGCADPSLKNLISAIKFAVAKNVILKIIKYSQLLLARKKVLEYLSLAKINAGIQSKVVVPKKAPKSIKIDDNSPVANLVSNILENAIGEKASDLHFEPQECGLVIRQRVDGLLFIIASLDKDNIQPINTRLKIMAKMDITERRLPQDGRINFIASEQTVDIRVSSLPTIWGEKIVLRLLGSEQSLLPIAKLGMSASQETNFKELLKTKQGLILVTGPTGSGKSHTLYSALEHIKDPTINISTAEDPVEIYLPFINQVQVNSNLGLDFKHALKTFLRQDPDVIMVGEIRDYETADIALKAAQTGHLVLSTLHTNNALQSLARLANLGINNFNIATGVKLIIAQRLLRRLCPYCKKYSSESSTYRANLNGCHYCNYGYKGRVGIYEFFNITASIAKKIQKNDCLYSFAESIDKGEYSSLALQAKNKIHAGITDTDEVLRVLGQIME